jgi:pimeloyl-ACP methyl ester carboxylesterase
MAITQTVERAIGPDTLFIQHDLMPGSSFALVYVHGLGGHRGGEKSAALAAVAHAAKVSFVSFDFRSHGASSGTMRDLTATRLLDDLETVRILLAEHGVTRLGLVGSSMGGFAAAWFAVRQPATIAACVLLAPAFRFLERRWETLTPEDHEQWRTTGTHPLKNQWLDTELGYPLIAEHARFTLHELTQHYRTPTLIYHGLADDIVPHTDSLDFLAQAPYPHIELRLLKSGDHRLTTFKDTIATEALAFVRQHST